MLLKNKILLSKYYRSYWINPTIHESGSMHPVDRKELQGVKQSENFYIQKRA